MDVDGKPMCKTVRKPLTAKVPAPALELQQLMRLFVDIGSPFSVCPQNKITSI